MNTVAELQMIFQSAFTLQPAAKITCALEALAETYKQALKFICKKNNNKFVRNGASPPFSEAEIVVKEPMSRICSEHWRFFVFLCIFVKVRCKRRGILVLRLFPFICTTRRLVTSSEVTSAYRGNVLINAVVFATDDQLCGY